MINGHCLGGGLELAITCDMRVCAAGAKLGMPPAKLGLIYGHTGLRKFLDTVGLARTKELFLTGRNVEAERAEEIGLVHEVFPDDELEEAGVELAAAIAANAPLSMRGNKRAIEVLNANPVLTAAQEAELVALRESCFGSEDFREGIQAFAEKRKPRWTASGVRDERRGGTQGAGRHRARDGGADRAGRRDRPRDPAAAAERGAARRRLRSAAAGDRRPAAIDKSGADDLRPGPRPLRRRHAFARAAAGGERGGPAGGGPLRAQGRVHPRPRRAT